MALMTMRSDAEVRKDIKEHLFWDIRLEGSDITVKVTDDVVTLAGTVPTFLARLYAEDDALSEPGIKAVDNKLEVRHAGIAKLPTDAELEENVRKLLVWSSSIDSTRIRISVQNGVVTLGGTVEAYWQKLRAGELAADVLGVRTVENTIAIVPALAYKDEAIARNIISALDRVVDIDVGVLNVEVKDGTVTLSGPVPDWMTYRYAENIARSARGVTGVTNAMHIERREERT